MRLKGVENTEHQLKTLLYAHIRHLLFILSQTKKINVDNSYYLENNNLFTKIL